MSRITVEKVETNQSSVADLNIGDVFEFEGKLYMKIEDFTPNKSYAAIELKTGEHVTFAEDVVPNLDVKCILRVI